MTVCETHGTLMLSGHADQIRLQHAGMQDLGKKERERKQEQQYEDGVCEELGAGVHPCSDTGIRRGSVLPPSSLSATPLPLYVNGQEFWLEGLGIRGSCCGVLHTTGTSSL